MSTHHPSGWGPLYTINTVPEAVAINNQNNPFIPSFQYADHLDKRAFLLRRTWYAAVRKPVLAPTGCSAIQFSTALSYGPP